nr:MAG TPA_asm: hypothetical protein [Caudoviricetes sp.]
MLSKLAKREYRRVSMLSFFLSAKKKFNSVHYLAKA